MTVTPEFLDLARRLAAGLNDDPELSALAAQLAEQIDRRLHSHVHGIDFACVRWEGVLYHFTAAQGHVVKLLWEAMQRCTPDVRQETLLDAAGSDCRRLSYLFRDNPAWGRLIVPGAQKGTFRLRRAGDDPTPPPCPSPLKGR